LPTVIEAMNVVEQQKKEEEENPNVSDSKPPIISTPTSPKMSPDRKLERIPSVDDDSASRSKSPPNTDIRKRILRKSKIFRFLLLIFFFFFILRIFESKLFI